MTRLWYGGTSADFVVKPGADVDVFARSVLPPNNPVATDEVGTTALLPLAADPFEVYTDAALTTVTTDLLDDASSPITQVTPSTDVETRAAIPRFQGPDEHEGPLWLSVNAVTGFRVEPESGPLYGRISSVETDIAAAQIDITDAETDLVALDVRTDVLESTAASPDYQSFSASGTWTKPDGAQKVFVECRGAGAAGGGAAATGVSQAAEGGGGGGGGYAAEWFDADDLAATVAVTVGVGGVAVSGASGGNGGDSTFGAHLTGSGGLAGIVGSAGAGPTYADGGHGSSGSGTEIHVGGDGGAGIVLAGAIPLRANHGGSSYGAGENHLSSDLASSAGNSGVRGSGGSGARNAASQSAKAGGNGGAGQVQVTTHF